MLHNPGLYEINPVYFLKKLLFYLYLDISLQANLTSAMTKVLSGEIALVWESAVLDNIARSTESCRYTTVSMGIGEFYYAFALTKNSLYTSMLKLELFRTTKQNFLM